MNSEIRKRLEKLEAELQRKSGGKINFGACLSYDEWRQALSLIDPDPNAAFAAIKSERIGVVVIVVGSPAEPANFAELVADPNPAAHFRAGRRAAWALVLDSGRIHPQDAPPQAFADALDRLFGWDGASDAVKALHAALSVEGGDLVQSISIMGAKPKPIRLEMSMDDARL